MSSQFLRKSAYLALSALLIVISAAFLANFNVQTAHAGGSPQPLYQLLSDQIVANATFTIYTQTKIDGTDTYKVHSHTTGSDYFVSTLGTDYICITRAKDSAKIPLCLPYSAIAGIKYQ